MKTRTFSFSFLLCRSSSFFFSSSSSRLSSSSIRFISSTAIRLASSSNRFFPSIMAFKPSESTLLLRHGWRRFINFLRFLLFLFLGVYLAAGLLCFFVVFLWRRRCCCICSSYCGRCWLITSFSSLLGGGLGFLLRLEKLGKSLTRKV